MMLASLVLPKEKPWVRKITAVYTEVGYDVLPLMFKDTPQYLAPFFRYEKYNTIAKAPDGWTDNPINPTKNQTNFSGWPAIQTYPTSRNQGGLSQL